MRKKDKIIHFLIILLNDSFIVIFNSNLNESLEMSEFLSFLSVLVNMFLILN